MTNPHPYPHTPPARHRQRTHPTRSPRRTRSDQGSGTIHVLTACLLLSTALATAILWAAISTARHQLTAAADLTALSAAYSLTTTPCQTAAQTAAANNVTLTACTPTPTDVTIQVS
ncbi:Rv3654c family TadE-like protein, partial [Kribbella yunnanensis]